MYFSSTRGIRRTLRFVAAAALFAGLAGGAPSARADGVDELFVTNFFGNNTTNASVTVYARAASGNTAPLRTLSGAATGLNGAAGLALDLTNNELFVGNI